MLLTTAHLVSAALMTSSRKLVYDILSSDLELPERSIRLLLAMISTSLACY